MKKLAGVTIAVLVGSNIYAATPTASIDPSANYFKIDVSRPPPTPTDVNVLNFPDVQAVGGTVNVGNFPAVQAIAGAVAITNLPLDADGALRVSIPGGKFIGVTTTAVSGAAGWRSLNLACNSQFGPTYPTARMCTSRDILQTAVTQWPTLPGNAWVQPVIVSAASAGFVDMSGISAGTPPELSCNAWSGQGTSTGLAVLSNGGFGLQGCQNGTVLVSCCTDGT